MLTTEDRLRGSRRAKQLALENETERQQEAAALLAALGHEPSAVEIAVVEQISARMIRARRLRERGRDDTEQSRLVAQLLRSIGMRPAPVAQKPSAAAWEALCAEVAADGGAA
jgi:hypothetical protein